LCSTTFAVSKRTTTTTSQPAEEEIDY